MEEEAENAAAIYVAKIWAEMQRRNERKMTCKNVEKLVDEFWDFRRRYLVELDQG